MRLNAVMTTKYADPNTKGGGGIFHFFFIGVVCNLMERGVKILFDF